MPQVMLQDSHQITLPSSIISQAHIAKNDMLDVSFQNGSIILKLVDVSSNHSSKEKPRTSIMDFAGITEGLYGETAEDVQSYLDEIRADRSLAWD